MYFFKWGIISAHEIYYVLILERVSGPIFKNKRKDKKVIIYFGEKMPY